MKKENLRIFCKRKGVSRCAVLLFRLRNFRITGFAETACGRQSVSYHRFTETLRKVTGGRKSTLLCNLCKTHIGGSQQFLTGKDPLLGQIIHRRDPIGFCESMRKIILVDLCNLCKFIQCNIFLERRINITLCPAAFADSILWNGKISTEEEA